LVATGGPGGLGAVALPDWNEAADEGAVDTAVFFQGVADPLEGAMPGKTETGLADAFAETEVVA